LSPLAAARGSTGGSDSAAGDHVGAAAAADVDVGVPAAGVETARAQTRTHPPACVQSFRPQQGLLLHQRVW
jgi:hypothetical protein